MIMENKDKKQTIMIINYVSFTFYVKSKTCLFKWT